LNGCCVLQDHYDDEHNKTMFHTITPDLQNRDKDHGVHTKTKTYWYHH